MTSLWKSGLRRHRLVLQVVLAMTISTGGSGLGAAGVVQVPVHGTYPSNSQWRDTVVGETDGSGKWLVLRPNRLDVAVGLVGKGVSVSDMLVGGEGPIAIGAVLATYERDGKIGWDLEGLSHWTYGIGDRAGIGAAGAVGPKARFEDGRFFFVMPGSRLIDPRHSLAEALKSWRCSSEGNWKAAEIGEMGNFVETHCLSSSVPSAWVGKSVDLLFQNVMPRTQRVGFDGRAMGNLPEWKKRFEEELLREEQLLKEKNDERLKKMMERQSYYLENPATADELVGGSAWDPWAVANSPYDSAYPDYCAAFRTWGNAMYTSYCFARIQ